MARIVGVDILRNKKVPYSLQYIKNYMDSDGVLETNYEDENNREINVVENRITELLTAKRGLNH